MGKVEEDVALLFGGYSPAGYTNKIAQEQIHGLLFSEQLSWQAIIYDLINSEQLDPWDIDIILLTNKYLEKIREIEELDFFISSKVLLAASLLLRIKSEILLSQDLQSLDNILFGKSEKKKYLQERIELDEEIPELISRTPLPRLKKVTLKELISALGKAIDTENKRIKKIVTARRQEIETILALPKKAINLKDQIKSIYSKIKEIFSTRKEKFPFSQLSGKTKENKVSTFVPLLHLDNQHKIVLEQEEHEKEIWIWLKKLYDEHYSEELKQAEKEVIEEIKKLEEKGEL